MLDVCREGPRFRRADCRSLDLGTQGEGPSPRFRRAGEVRLELGLDVYIIIYNISN